MLLPTHLQLDRYSYSCVGLVWQVRSSVFDSAASALGWPQLEVAGSVRVRVLLLSPLLTSSLAVYQRPSTMVCKYLNLTSCTRKIYGSDMSDWQWGKDWNCQSVNLHEKIERNLPEGRSMLKTSPMGKVKVPGLTSGRYLLLDVDPKDRQVDPADCHRLPLLPHV